MWSALNVLCIFLEHTSHLAGLLLPDVQVISNAESGLDVGDQEGILSGGRVLTVHDSDVLSVAIVVLSESSVLELP